MARDWKKDAESRRARLMLKAAKIAHPHLTFMIHGGVYVSQTGATGKPIRPFNWQTYTGDKIALMEGLERKGWKFSYHDYFIHPTSAVEYYNVWVAAFKRDALFVVSKDRYVRLSKCVKLTKID